MVRQWQETFYEKNYSASPILSPDFVMLAGAHGIAAANVTKRAEVTPTATKARTSGKPFLINFAVEKEDGVYPMITPGAALHEMVRRPTGRGHDPLLETAEDE
jgi:acetolactate synthase-1/2/3 large subunit